MTSSSPVGVAIIGLGTVGRRFVEQFDLHAEFVVVGGWDSNPAAREAATADFALGVSETAEELISAPAVDVVYIAVPPLFHEHYVDLVVAAGKTVFCEKPLGVDDVDTAAMVARVDASGSDAAVNFVFGAAPSAVRMVEEVRDGSCGTVTGADLRLHFCRWPRDWQAGATWLRDRDQGGWVREVVSHYVFLIHRLFGPARIVHTHVGYPDDGTSEQSLSAVLDCGGITVRLVGTSDAAGCDEVEFTVRGTDRTLRLTDWYRLTAAQSDGPWQQLVPDEQASGPAAYSTQLGQVAELARGNPNSLSTFTEAFAVQQLVEALLVPEVTT